MNVGEQKGNVVLMKETEVCGQGGDKISQLHLRRAQTAWEAFPRRPHRILEDA